MNPSENIDKQIAELSDWRGEMYSTLRKLINESAPELKEDWKWDTGVWANKTNVCAVGVFKDRIKINFFKGALILDPEKMFNNGLESKNSRSIDFYEGDKIDEEALKKLIRAAIENNK